MLNMNTCMFNILIDDIIKMLILYTDNDKIIWKNVTDIKKKRNYTHFKYDNIIITVSDTDPVYIKIDIIHKKYIYADEYIALNCDIKLLKMLSNAIDAQSERSKYNTIMPYMNSLYIKLSRMVS